jgi:ADP-heptose:LPS heptosyltransferase
MKRILIVNVNWLGDTLFATPFIRAVRDSHPKAYIAILTHPRCYKILEGNPHIDEIIIYDEKNSTGIF